MRNENFSFQIKNKKNGERKHLISNLNKCEIFELQTQQNRNVHTPEPPSIDCITYSANSWRMYNVVALHPEWQVSKSFAKKISKTTYTDDT